VEGRGTVCARTTIDVVLVGRGTASVRIHLDPEDWRHLTMLVGLELDWGHRLLDAYDTVEAATEETPEVDEARAVIEAGRAFPLFPWWQHPEAWLDRED
jgi:hypothetical protein